MPKKFRDRILFRGNKTKATRALPLAKKLFNIARVRAAGSRYFSEWFRDVFPGVHVRIEINGRYRTAMIWAEVITRFIATFSATQLTPNTRHMHYLFYDPEKNSFSGIAELDQADHPWMDSTNDLAEWAYWTPKPEATLYPVITDVVGAEAPTASLQKDDEGDYVVINSANAENIAPPYDLTIPYKNSGFGDESLRAYPIRWRDLDGTQWGQVTLERLVANPSAPPPQVLNLEKHLVKRVPPAIVWTSELVLSDYSDTLPEKEREVFGGFATNRDPEGNSTKMYSRSIRGGTLENPLYAQETIQRIYEYDRVAKTQTAVVTWTFPDNDPALQAYVGLGAAGEFHFFDTFLEDAHDQWCGYALLMHNFLGGANADIHFYLAPLQDKIDKDDVTWSAGMANVQKAFTFNMSTEFSGYPTPDNQAYRATRFWHIGKNQFAFVINENSQNNSGDNWPYVIGVYNWNDDTYKVVYRSEDGKNASAIRHHSQWMTCSDFVRRDLSTSKGVTYNVLGKQDEVTGNIEQTEWSDGTAEDVDGIVLNIDDWGISMYEAYEN
jgi:hypothetical protein